MLAGSFAYESEGLSDAEAVNKAYAAFRSCFSAAVQGRATTPTATHVTRWCVPTCVPTCAAACNPMKHAACAHVAPGSHAHTAPTHTASE